MSELLTNIDPKNLDLKKINFSELFKTTEIISTQEEIYLQLRELALEQIANPIYPESSGLYEKINTFLQTLMDIWGTKSQILFASQKFDGFKWEKSSFDNDIYLRNPYYRNDSKITLSPKKHNDFYECDQIGVYITNRESSPHGSCSVEISLVETGMAITTSNLNLTETPPRMKFEFCSSHFDGQRLHTTELKFIKGKGRSGKKIFIEGEEKLEYPYKNNKILPPRITSNFQLFDIPQTNTSIVKQS